VAVTVKTIKKKPLAIKKPASPAAGEAGEEGAASPTAGAPQAPVRPVKKASYTFAGVCAILVFLMFAAILTLQILEWQYYEAPPKSAFPPFGIGLDKIPIPGSARIMAPPAAEEDVSFDDEGLGEDGLEDAPLDDAVPVE
jgi:hypothetical protein